MNADVANSFNYPSKTDKHSFMLWAYGGKFITPWVARFRNQLTINETFKGEQPCR